MKPKLKTCSERFDVALGVGGHARMENAMGWRVTATVGALWVTQDGDGRDVVLKAGESFAFDRSAALVSALGAATAQFSQLEDAAASLGAPYGSRGMDCLELLAA